MISPREVLKSDHCLPCESSVFEVDNEVCDIDTDDSKQQTTTCSSTAAADPEKDHQDSTDSVKGIDSPICFLSESSHSVSDLFLVWSISGLSTHCADLSSNLASKCSSARSPSVLVNHALCPQEHLDREDRVLWQDSSRQLDSHSTRESPGGTGVHAWSSIRCSSKESIHRVEQGRQAQGRPADPASDQVPFDPDWPRDHQAALCFGMSRGHDGLSSPWDRSAGVWPVQQQDVPGGLRPVPLICDLDPGHLQGERRSPRSIKLAPEALCRVVPQHERGEQDEAARIQTAPQDQEGLQGSQSSRDGDSVRFLIQPGDRNSSSRDGEGSFRGGGNDLRCRVPHPGVGGRDSCFAASAEGQEASSSCRCSPVDPPGSHLPKNSAKEWTANLETVKTALTSREQNHIKSQVSDRFETDWCNLVNYQRLVFLEVCCSPESVLTSTCLDKLGPGSAERL